MAKSTGFSSDLSPKYVIIGFLYITPMHGYDLHKHLETDLREVWHMSQSQAYNVINALKKNGMITATLQNQEKRPDREVLQLTDQGRIEFETWLYTPTPGSARAIRVEFITRLFFASNLSEDLYLKLIQEQADSIRDSLRELQSRLALVTMEQIFNRMGLELRISQLEAVLIWVEKSTLYFVEGMH